MSSLGVTEALALLRFVIWLYLLVVLGRFVLEAIRAFARQWRPQGVMVVVAETLYTLTDPPLKALRKVIPSVDLGGVRFDLAGLVLLLGLQLVLVIL